ncbi:MAG: hypothetical protein JW959_07680 [Pirellulales bacterium]|nr:hypothetical protein [Pirellulales bacterium]
MKSFKKHCENRATLALRVVYGDESGEPKIERAVDSRRPPLRLNSEAEQYWAGRFPAARHSTRVAA